MAHLQTITDGYCMSRAWAMADGRKGMRVNYCDRSRYAILRCIQPSA